MGKWRMALVIFSVLAMVWLIIGVAITNSKSSKPAPGQAALSDLPKPFLEEHADYDIVGCYVGWVASRGTWMWVDDKGDPAAYLSGLPEGFERDACKSCRYWMKLKLDKREAKSVPPGRYVLEMLDFKRMPCKDHGGEKPC